MDIICYALMTAIGNIWYTVVPVCTHGPFQCLLFRFLKAGSIKCRHFY